MIGMAKMRTIFILAATLFTATAFANPMPPTAAEVSVGTAVGGPGMHVVLPIVLSNNDVEISGASIPLKYSSSDMTIDSVSFVGTMIPLDMVRLSAIDNTERVVEITLLPPVDPNYVNATITASSGILAYVHATIELGAPDQTIVVDSLNKEEFIFGYPTFTRVALTDIDAVTYLPFFSAGEVSVDVSLDADDGGTPLPLAFELKQNYPNPFNPSTTIEFTLPERSPVSLKIYNLLGQEIETLVDGTLNAGLHTVEWYGAGRSSGIYFYRLAFKDKTITKKMALMK
jgi:hypothetical protein